MDIESENPPSMSGGKNKKHSQTFFGGKHFRPKIFWSKIFFSRKLFWSKHIFGRTIMRPGRKKGAKTFSVENIFE